MDHKKVLKLLTNLVLVSNFPVISDERRFAAKMCVNYYALLIDFTTNGSSYSMLGSMLEESFKKHMEILRCNPIEYLKALKSEDKQLDLF